MSEYFPIEIRHLDSVVNPLCSTDLLPVQIGNSIDGFETRSAEISDLLGYINNQNQNSNITSINVSNSAMIAGNLYVGNVQPVSGVKFFVDGNAIISGSLSALSGITYLSTNIVQTTSLLISAASGVGLTVIHNLEFPIAQFYDSENIALHIDGTSERAGRVGIKTTEPNEALTVVGNISTSNVLYGLHANTQTAYLSSLSAYNLYVVGSSILESEPNSVLTIGNVVSSRTNLIGDVYINSVTSTNEFKTVLGSNTSDVYINGYLFTKNLSSGGNLFINNQTGQNNVLNVGNINAVNNVFGTTTLSGNVYLDGNVNLNVEGSYNTNINNIDSTGSVYIGNPFNTLNVNANKFTHNSNLTSELISLTFSSSEFDSLTSVVDTIFSDLTIVYFVSGLNPLNPSITSVQYKYVENVEGLNIDLTQDVVNLGRNNFATNIKGNTITSTAGSLLNLYTLSGGIVKIGESNNNLEIKGFNLKINDPSDGTEKSTYINSQEGSGNLELGNSTNYTLINGLSTYVNTLCAANTVIGNLSGSVEIYNLTVYNSLSALVDTLNISNINSQNITSSNIANLNNTNISGNINTVGTAFFNNNLGVGAQPTERLTVNGNVSSTGKIYSDNGSSDLWNTPNVNLVFPITDEFQIVSVGDGIIRFNAPHNLLLSKVKIGINEPPVGSNLVATLSSITNNTAITTLNLLTGGYVATNNNLSYILNEDDRLCVNINQVGSDFNGAGLKIYLTGRYII
jgi:hypothetical protein